jgi:hypothetical protein
MLEYEEDIEQEIAPDLSVIKQKKKLLNKNEIDTVFSNDMVKKSSRISAKRSNTKPKPIVVKKTLPGTKLDKCEDTLKCVTTKNSVNTKSDDITSYYKDKGVSVSASANSYDENSDTNDENDEKVATVREKLNDGEKEKLKGIIQLFLAADEKCTRISNEVKDVRNEKKQYEEYILEFMGEKNKEKIIHNDSILRRKVNQSRPKPKEENILETLAEVFNDPDVAYEITKKIFDSVPLEEKITLKREKEGDDKGKKPTKK